MSTVSFSQLCGLSLKLSQFFWTILLAQTSDRNELFKFLHIRWTACSINHDIDWLLLSLIPDWVSKTNCHVLRNVSSLHLYERYVDKVVWKDYESFTIKLFNAEDKILIRHELSKLQLLLKVIRIWVDLINFVKINFSIVIVNQSNQQLTVP